MENRDDIKVKGLTGGNEGEVVRAYRGGGSKRERERAGKRGESQALHSWVRPIVMVTAARRDERAAEKTNSLSLAVSLSLSVSRPEISGRLISVPGCICLRLRRRLLRLSD